MRDGVGGVGLVEGDKRCAREEDVNAVLALQIWSYTHARTRKSTRARGTLQEYHLHFKLVAACRVCGTHCLFHLRHTLARERRLVYDGAAPEQQAVAGDDVLGGVVGRGGTGGGGAFGCD